MPSHASGRAGHTVSAALTWMLTQRCYNLSVLAAGTEGMKCCREACMLSRATDPPGWRWACCRAALTWTLTQRWHGLDNCDAADNNANGPEAAAPEVLMQATLLELVHTPSAQLQMLTVI